MHNVCFGACLNTEPGYQCYECPEGYTGTYEDAEALTVNQRVFEYMNLQYSNFTNQTCYDIDECGVNNGGCDPLMPCVNTPVSKSHSILIMLNISCINRLFAYCKGGNFNIHIWAWFGYFIS